MANSNNPVVQTILDYLSTPVAGLDCSEQHVKSEKTRRPIDYDLHMPLSLQPLHMKVNISLVSLLTSQLANTFDGLHSVQDESLDVQRMIDAWNGSSPFSSLVLTSASGEADVHVVQAAMHRIACYWATVACFDIKSEDYPFQPVFHGRPISGIHTIPDSVIGCLPAIGGPEKWKSLWPRITAPIDLKEPFFHALYTEEYKNIRAGSPRTILGIYIILWCIQKGFLTTFWPENDCRLCHKFKKSHHAARYDNTDLPFDAEDKGEEDDDPADTNAIITALKTEINRLLKVAGTYDNDHSIPPEEERTAKKKRPRKDTDNISTESPLSLHKEALEKAFRLACFDPTLNLPADLVQRGLFKWVLHAAYMLVQVWSQMVTYNGTVSRLTCHNIGVILMRDRVDGTLTVSDFFEYKDAPVLHMTALTVYAYDDAIQRWRRQGEEHWEDPYRGETIEQQKAAGTFSDGEHSSGEDSISDEEPPKKKRRGGPGAGRGGGGDGADGADDGDGGDDADDGDDGDDGGSGGGGGGGSGGGGQGSGGGQGGGGGQGSGGSGGGPSGRREKQTEERAARYANYQARNQELSIDPQVSYVS
ncbi:hypothetical protein C8R47DRAFT_372735 [Mycena vitilis]|nr:hypothetical protein C8R47DRAFT_372735 [Mycena vitilis]